MKSYPLFLPALLLAGASALALNSAHAQDAAAPAPAPAPADSAPAEPRARLRPRDNPQDWVKYFTLLGHQGAAMIPRGVKALDVQRRFAELDADKNGGLSLLELGSNRWMRTMDSDFSGSVSREEVDTFLATLEKAAKLPNGDLGTKHSMFGSDDKPVRQPPRVVAPWPLGVGSIMAPDVLVKKIGGSEPASFRALCGGKATVAILTSPSCPVSKKYGPALKRMEETYGAKDVRFVFVAISKADSDAELAALQLKGHVVRDESGALLRALGARTTAEAFLFDDKKTLIYRGAVDDQYGIGYNKDAPQFRYLADAIDHSLAGATPVIAATTAPACELEIPKEAPVEKLEGITYHNRISRILQANCSECHTKGGLAPFALDTLEQISAKAKTIARVLDDATMPPWYAACDPAGKSSPWINDRSLRAEDKAALLAWLAARAEGDPKDAPRPHAEKPEWAQGKPDMMLQIPEPIEVKAEGVMPWVNVIVDPGLTEDRWVEAMEVQPTAHSVVHHVLIFIRLPNTQQGSRVAGFSDDEMDGFFAAYAPGTIPGIYPKGFAKMLPAGSKLRFQIHYTPNGTATRDQTRLGLRFAKNPPQHEVETMPIANVMFMIPPGASNYALQANVALTSDVRILSLTPHMHLRGKAFRFDVALPDGGERLLVDIPRYDFNWQIPCAYADPILLPAGSKLRATGWFDNSKDNPSNPDHKAYVRWGQKTTDEMMLGYVEFYRERTSASPKTVSSQAP